LTDQGFAVPPGSIGIGPAKSVGGSGIPLDEIAGDCLRNTEARAFRGR
jgi:hypothetical protein